MASLELFERFVEQIRVAPVSGANLDLFLLHSESRLRIYYAPFDFVNGGARIAIVGITPGRDSMIAAYQAARVALANGCETIEVLRRAKQAGSFSNMRFTIATMLDEIGVGAALGIRSCDELFTSRFDLLHPTSCVRYPVFVWDRAESRWANYTGHSPTLLKWNTARDFLEKYLVAELQTLPNALVIPCGEAVTAALRYLSDRKLIDADQCLFGFPHASGANGHRLKHFNARKSGLSERVSRWADRRQLQG